MTWKRFAVVAACALVQQVAGAAAPARPRKPTPPQAVATAANVEYCFARVRGNDPERLPQAYLVLRMHVTVSYLNDGARPVILPLEHQRAIFMALNPGKMSEFKQGFGLDFFNGLPKPLDHLPPDVSADNPSDPKNDVFAVIPARGQLTPPLDEMVTLPVDRKGVFRKYPDLRGHRVYVKLRYTQREMTAALAAHLSDQWARFGVPWTGVLTTNTILIDVPANPQGELCKDKYTPAHPNVGEDDQK
jgi:hypothetical protein